MVTIDSKLGIAIYRPASGSNPARFIRFIETSIEMLIHEGIICFVIELSGMPSLSARGLSTLIKLGGSLPGGSIMLAGIPDRIMLLLNATGLAKMFVIHNDVPSAIKAFISREKMEEKELSMKTYKLEDLVVSGKPATA